MDRFMRSRKAGGPPAGKPPQAGPPAPGSSDPPTPFPALTRQVKPHAPPCTVGGTIDLRSPFASPAKCSTPAKSLLHFAVVPRETRAEGAPLRVSHGDRQPGPKSDSSGLGAEHERASGALSSVESPRERDREGAVQDTAGTSSSTPSRGTWAGHVHQNLKGAALGRGGATHYESPSKRARERSPGTSAGPSLAAIGESPSKRGRGVLPRDALPGAQRPAGMCDRGPVTTGIAAHSPQSSGGSPGGSSWDLEEANAYVTLLIGGGASLGEGNVAAVQSAACDSPAGVLRHEETIVLLDTPQQRPNARPGSPGGERDGTLPSQSATVPARTGGGTTQAEQPTSHTRLPVAHASSRPGRGGQAEVRAGGSRGGRKGRAKGSRGGLAHERPPGVPPLDSLQFGFTRSAR